MTTKWPTAQDELAAFVQHHEFEVAALRAEIAAVVTMLEGGAEACSWHAVFAAIERLRTLAPLVHAEARILSECTCPPGWWQSVGAGQEERHISSCPQSWLARHAGKATDG